MLMHVVLCPAYTLLVQQVSQKVYFLSSSELSLFHLDRIKVVAQTAL